MPTAVKAQSSSSRNKREGFFAGRNTGLPKCAWGVGRLRRFKSATFFRGASSREVSQNNAWDRDIARNIKNPSL